MALPELPVQGQNPWYVDRTNWDNAVELQLDGFPAQFVAPLAKITTDLIPAARLTYRNVDDYGAKGDGITNDTPAIQAAIDAGGNLSVIRFSSGKRYRCEGGLITNTWQRLEGVASGFGSGATTPAELFFVISGSTVGIRARSYTTLRDLLVRGPGDAVGTCVGLQMYDSVNNSVNMNNVSFDDWATGVHLDQVYYGEFKRLGLRRNGTGLRITSCLNITLENPQINCQRAAGTPGIGIDGTARALNIFGGSIEQFQSGIKMFHSETLNLYGVYFESTLSSTNIRGIDTPSFINTTINAYGCYIYMPNLTTWIEQRGGTGRTLTARGNSFIAGAAAANVVGSAAYRFTAGQVVDLAGDNWVRVETALTTYTAVDSGSLPYPGSRVEIPVGYTTSGSIAGTVLDGKLSMNPTEAKTLASAGALTVNPLFGHAELTLNANLSGLTLTSVGSNKQELTITIIQDATGGRTYVYPTNFSFAGGTAPNNTTASTRTTVTMRYDGVANRWHEVSRAVGIPN